MQVHHRPQPNGTAQVHPVDVAAAHQHPWGPVLEPVQEPNA